MNRYSGALPTHWHRVCIPDHKRGAEAASWCRGYQSKGKFYFSARPSFDTISYVIDTFYFSRQKDAVVFALKWGS